MERILEDKEILQKVLEALEVSANKFSTALKYRSPGTVYHILEGRNNISDAFIENTIRTYTNVNYNFMKSGQEPILLDEAGKQNQMNLFNIVEEKTGVSNSALEEKMNTLIYHQMRTNELLVNVCGLLTEISNNTKR